MECFRKYFAWLSACHDFKIPYEKRLAETGEAEALNKQ